MSVRSRLHRERVLSPSGGESMTKQSEADNADINVIMARYVDGQGISPQMLRQGLFGDVSEVGDFVEMVNRVRSAEEAFMQLPATVRDHFRNDPAELIGALEDESRRDELVKLGVLEVPVEPAPVAPADAEPPKKA